jgi:hypothetical protein
MITEPRDDEHLFAVLIERFAAVGGVELGLPERETPARAATSATEPHPVRSAAFPPAPPCLG